MNILFLDIESSGLDPNRHSVLQIAAEYWKDDELIDTFNKKISNNECIVDLRALKCNGLNLNQIRLSNDEHRVVNQFVEFLLKIDSEKPITVCGNGIAFDVAFIRTLLLKHKVEGLDGIFSHKLLDLSAIALFLQETGLIDTKNNYHLNHLAKIMGVGIDESKFHEAMYDVSISRQVYFAMLKLTKSLKAK